MRFGNLAATVLTLVLLIAVPVGGAPNLRQGSEATYQLSASISFSPPSCETSPTSSSQTTAVCPMIAVMPPAIDINGTFRWTATAVNSTTAVLNITRDITTSFGGGLTVPDFRSTGSFNESINLATRIVSVMPLFTPEIDQALQMAQTGMTTSPATYTDWSSTMNIVESAIMRHPVHTMWWVNGPLKVNQTIPVLVFPTNVTGSATVNLGSLGTRTAWTLIYSLPLLSPIAKTQSFGSYSIPVGDNFHATFTFNYDSMSDLLLNASASIHLGFGLDIEASLILTSTNLNLDQRLPSPTPSTGGTGTGSGSGSDTGTSSGNGPSSGSGSGPGSNPGSTPQSIPVKTSMGVSLWVYSILGIVAVAIVADGLWTARRRARKALGQNHLA